jgi:hypothetical protein
MDTDLVTLVFDPRMPLLQFEYLHIGIFLYLTWAYILAKFHRNS